MQGKKHTAFLLLYFRICVIAYIAPAITLVPSYFPIAKLTISATPSQGHNQRDSPSQDVARPRVDELTHDVFSVRYHDYQSHQRWCSQAIQCSCVVKGSYRVDVEPVKGHAYQCRYNDHHVKPRSPTGFLQVPP